MHRRLLTTVFLQMTIVCIHKNLSGCTSHMRVQTINDIGNVENHWKYGAISCNVSMNQREYQQFDSIFLTNRKKFSQKKFPKIYQIESLFSPTSRLNFDFKILDEWSVNSCKILRHVDPNTLELFIY